ncbi:MAG: transglycosylase SLT domain-containing protein [Chakrabartia sp.]
MAQTALISSPSSQTIRTAVARAAAAHGVDFGYLLNQAQIESGLNPSAKAPNSSAAGLFQFTSQTWLAMIKTHGPEMGLDAASRAITTGLDGRLAVADPAQRAAILDLRFNPDIAATMAGALAADHRAMLEQELGRPAEAVDLYMAHFLGGAGALRFARALAANPDQPAAALFPEAAATNRPIFFAQDGSARSLNDIRQRLAARLGGATSPSGSGSVFAYSDNNAPVRLEMAEIEAMPGHLSLGFAQAAYQRLAAMGGAA